MFNKKVNYFGKDGLSMSDAQAISNLCNQRSEAIIRELNKANSCSKHILLHTLTGGNASNDVQLTTQEAKPLEHKVTVDKLKDLGKYAGTQAFLMEHIKLKQELLDENAKASKYTSIEFTPETQALIDEYIKLKEELQTLGYEKPSLEDADVRYSTTVKPATLLDYLMNEALAAKIGTFIHKGGKLDTLRKETADLKSTEYTKLPDNRTAIVSITPSHKDSDLEKLHEELADIHRSTERKVNGYKALAHNHETEQEQIKQDKYTKELVEFNEKYSLLSNKVTQANTAAESAKAKEIRAFREALKEERLVISNYKIIVPDAIKSVVDEFNTTKSK